MTADQPEPLLEWAQPDSCRSLRAATRISGPALSPISGWGSPPGHRDDATTPVRSCARDDSTPGMLSPIEYELRHADNLARDQAS